MHRHWPPLTAIVYRHCQLLTSGSGYGVGSGMRWRLGGWLGRLEDWFSFARLLARDTRTTMIASRMPLGALSLVDVCWKPRLLFHANDWRWK
ncbi:hypothetical protein Tco_0230148 [Tanacetum coccineum]